MEKHAKTETQWLILCNSLLAYKCRHPSANKQTAKIIRVIQENSDGEHAKTQCPTSFGQYRPGLLCCYAYRNEFLEFI